MANMATVLIFAVIINFVIFRLLHGAKEYNKKINQLIKDNGK